MNDNEMMAPVFAKSIAIARHFGRRHTSIVRAIEDIISVEGAEDEFNQTNFVWTTYIDPRGRTHKAIDLTRDGFMVTVMGLTGKKAHVLKRTYMDDLKRMERTIKEKLPDASHSYGYHSFKEVANSSEDVLLPTHEALKAIAA